MKTLFPIACCVAFLSGVANAQQSTTTTTTTTTYVPSTTIVGARVLGSEGDEIGQISDVILDKQSGCMAYVVLSIDQSGARKLVAAPWTIISPGSDNHTYSVRVAREKIYSAPVWESSRIEEYSQATWISNVYSYYGVQPQPGLNIQANVGVNAGSREETETNLRNSQGRDRSEDRPQMGQEERNASERNPDMLTQPSPGLHGHRSTASQNNETAPERQTRREQRQQRRAQRESSSAAGAESTANQSQPGNAEERAERRQAPAPEQAEPMKANENQRQSTGANANEQQPTSANDNQRQRSHSATGGQVDAQEQNAGTSEQSNRSHQRNRAHQPAVEPSPTP